MRQLNVAWMPLIVIFADAERLVLPVVIVEVVVVVVVAAVRGLVAWWMVGSYRRDGWFRVEWDVVVFDRFHWDRDDHCCPGDDFDDQHEPHQWYRLEHFHVVRHDAIALLPPL